MYDFDLGYRNSSIDLRDVTAVIFGIDPRGLLRVQIAVVRFDFEVG